jgi:hypothetical protein
MNGGSAARAANGGSGIRLKRRRMKLDLKDGLEAALRANPEVLDTCKPKTCLGRLICGMVLEASKGKTTSLRQVMALLDWVPPEPTEEFRKEAWDWNEDGVWETMPEAEPAGEPVEEEDGPAKKELHRRLTRLLEGNAADQARAMTIIEALSSEKLEDASAPEPVSTA